MKILLYFQYRVQRPHISLIYKIENTISFTLWKLAIARQHIQYIPRIIFDHVCICVYVYMCVYCIHCLIRACISLYIKDLICIYVLGSCSFQKCACVCKKNKNKMSHTFCVVLRVLRSIRTNVHICYVCIRKICCVGRVTARSCGILNILSFKSNSKYNSFR